MAANRKRIQLAAALVLTTLCGVLLTVGIALTADMPKSDKTTPKEDSAMEDKLKWDKTFPKSE